MIVNLYIFYSYRLIGKPTTFVQIQEFTLSKTTVTSSTTKVRRSPLSLDQKVSSLRITLNIDGPPILSQTHAHPSHSQTCHLLTSSSSLGVPVPLDI